MTADGYIARVKKKKNVCIYIVGLDDRQLKLDRFISFFC